MLMDCGNHTAQSESWDLKLPPQEPTWSQLGVRFAVSEDSFWEGGVAFVIAFVIAFVTTFVVQALDHIYFTTRSTLTSEILFIRASIFYL